MLPLNPPLQAGEYLYFQAHSIPSEHHHVPSFESFFQAVDGYRAAILLLRTYQRKYKLLNLAQLISRFAPDSENHTTQYIDFVASKLVVSPATTLDLFNDDLVSDLVLAMHHFETGRVWFGREFINAAIKKINSEKAA